MLVTEVSPDGAHLATIETITETIPPSPAPHEVPYLFLAAADGGARDTVARSTATTGWLGGRLLRDDAADAAPFEQRICLLATNTGFECDRIVAAEAGHDLWDPAVSPDGTLVAVTRAPLGGFSGDIAVYSAATAQVVRAVSSGPGDSGPTWSPDGRSIAFARGDGGLWVTPATGAPGSERRILASGLQPVWVRGGGRPRLTGPQARPRHAARAAPGGRRAAAARASACSAGSAGAGARRHAAGRRGADDLQAPARSRPRHAARAGPRRKRLEDARRAGAVARAKVNCGWIVEGSGVGGGGVVG